MVQKVSISLLTAIAEHYDKAEDPKTAKDIRTFIKEKIEAVKKRELQQEPPTEDKHISREVKINCISGSVAVQAAESDEKKEEDDPSRKEPDTSCTTEIATAVALIAILCVSLHVG